MRYLLCALILTSCQNYYSVEKIGDEYVCEHHSSQMPYNYEENIAFCKTAEECRKICDEERRKSW